MDQPTSEEPTFADLLALVRERKATILAPALILGVLAGGAASMQPAVYEGRALVRIGIVNGRAVEPVSSARERLDLRSLQDRVIAAMKFPPDSPEAALYRTTLRSKCSCFADPLELRVRAYSPDQVRQMLEATVAELSRIHEMQRLPAVELLRSRLAQVKQEISNVRSLIDMDDTATRKQRAVGHDDRGRPPRSSSVLAMSANTVWLASILGLEAKIEQQLSPQMSYPTSMLAPVELEPKPVGPKTAAWITIAAVAGLFLGLVLAFFKRPGGGTS